MTNDEYGRVIYLVLLLCVIGGSFLLRNGQDRGKTAQQFAIWGLIFAGVAAAYGLWSDIRGANPRSAILTESGQIEVPRASDGHYYLTLDINSLPVEFMIDTGASDVVLTQADARRVGIDTDGLIYASEASTANGIVKTARVRLQDVSVQGTDEGGMVAWVNQGDLDVSLLGMDYLQTFTRMEFVGGKLVLTR